ncbi:MAG: sigma-70 family RNA polymerase sigma factor [Tepidisphaeraceae bacterium]|jgi:RNA polymerase sigma factor (sigma-70 family)
MTQWTEAERYMMDQIRRGSDEAWSQLVERYQGRLIAFARRRAPRSLDAEDLVQDTFLLFLRGLPQYREQASIETFLFVILRRRLAEAHRGKRVGVCELPQWEETGDVNLPAPDPTASSYARRDEQRQAAHAALGAALDELVHRMKERADLPDLQILEMVFYAQLPNQRIAAEMGVEPNHVALLKHRWIKQLRERVEQSMAKSALPWDAPEAMDSLLTEIWEDQRPSCPKRSTVGGYVLGTLDEPWRRYVDFHVNRLNCSFCRANLEDLQQQSQQNASSLRHRILQSTVGFLHKA